MEINVPVRSDPRLSGRNLITATCRVTNDGYAFVETEDHETQIERVVIAFAGGPLDGMVFDSDSHSLDRKVSWIAPIIFNTITNRGDLGERFLQSSIKRLREVRFFGRN